MHEVITGVEQVTPEWLTRILYEKGYLNQGQVISVQEVNRPLHTVPWFANISFLETSCSGQASKSAPRRLFLKVPKPNLKPAGLLYGKKKVEFYNTIANAMDDPLQPQSPLPRCF
ncbi:MAG: hypothetical protein V3S14_13620 [Anaerolineae bacterium]